MYSINGPPKGANVTSNQGAYDIVYKDIIVNKNGLNGSKSNFIFQLGNYFEQIYKAEMISGTIKFDGGIPVNVINSTFILSIKDLNGGIINIAQDPGTTNSGIGIFCQIPDNFTPLANASDLIPRNTISSFINNSPFTAMQFYNPPIGNINKFDISFYDLYGTNLLISASNFIISFYLTIRIYYFQKRNATTAFSTALQTFSPSGTTDSLFEY
jgi:hypothetical protein